MPDVKMVFFDMEGTLLKKAATLGSGETYRSAWAALAQELGPSAFREEKETQQKWDSGAYRRNYLLWMEETIAIHRKYGLTKNLFCNVLGAFDYHAGVFEVCVSLQSRGITTVLVSGGFKHQADKAKHDLNLNHSFAACEYFWDDRGNLHHWNLLPADDEGKKEFALSMMREYGITTDECAFIGDSNNDISLAKCVRVPIAFNASQGLKDVCGHRIISQQEGAEDFKAILEFL